MSAVDAIIAEPAPWLASPGAHDGIVVSSRIRLARTVAGWAFRRTLSKAKQAALVEHLFAAVRQGLAFADAGLLRLERLSDIERQALIERQLISRELGAGRHPSGLAMDADQSTALMLNEEDHLRVQVIASGLELEALLDRAVAVDRALEAQLTYAVHPQWGHLTACHTNVGTGLRASAMLHLPGLAESGELKQVLHALERLHMAVRGQHGEGSEASGHLYQVSNARTLGSDEPTIVAAIHTAVERIVAAEQLARRVLLSEQRIKVTDKAWRALAVLRAARSLTTEELIDHLGWVRFGIATGVIEGASAPSWTALDRAFLRGQPAHLQLTERIAPKPGDRDRLRADLVRSWLA